MGYHQPTSYLPHDLIIEILKWLPPETLLTCTGVCNLWLDTITGSKFMSKHRSHFGNSSDTDRIVIPVGTIAHPSTPAMKVRLFPDANSLKRKRPDDAENATVIAGDSNWIIWGSCNGIVMYTGRWGNQGIVRVCNPCIRRTISLPNYPSLRDLDPHDPGNGLCFGIGFDSMRDDYKVVMMRTYPMRSAEAGVYSLNLKKWRKLETPIPDRVVVGKSTFLRGFIHWLTMPLVSSVKRNNMIMTFDISNEVFGEMQLPEMLNNERPLCGTSITILKDLLCVMIAYGGNVTGGCCDLWTMNEYGVVSSWTKLFVVQFLWPVLGSAKLIVGGKLLLCSRAGCVAIDGKPVYEFGKGKPCVTILLYDLEMGVYSNLQVDPMTHIDRAVAIEASLDLLNYVEI